MKRTPLYDNHKRLGARFTEFGGWDMPVQYSGVIDEHTAVRTAAGLFDVSHMGEVTVKGDKALAFLEHVTSNDVSKLVDGKAQYSLLPNEKGGIVDDIIVYRLADNDYLLCVNAANSDKDFAWLTKQNAKFGADLKNVSNDYAQIAIQGPRAVEIFETTVGVPAGSFSLAAMPSFTTKKLIPSAGALKGKELLVARTGYTGEDGFEIFSSPADAPLLWEALIECGAPHGLKPCGLGARDTLRLEACLPLHGHELTDDRSALVSGLGWVVKLQKGEFIGQPVLAAEKERGLAQKLVGFEVKDPGIVREGAPIFSGDRQVGVATSGTKTPTVNKAIGLAVVDAAASEVATKLHAEVRGKRLAIEVIKTPFYKRNK